MFFKVLLMMNKFHQLPVLKPTTRFPIEKRLKRVHPLPAIKCSLLTPALCQQQGMLLKIFFLGIIFSTWPILSWATSQLRDSPPMNHVKMLEKIF